MSIGPKLNNSIEVLETFNQADQVGQGKQVDQADQANDTSFDVFSDDDFSPEDLGNQPKTVNGKTVMKNAKVVSLREDLLASVPKRHTIGKFIGNYFKSILRDVMKFCHAIRNGFAFAPSKRSRATLEAKFETNKPYAFKSNISFVHTEKPEGEFAPTVTYDTKDIAAGMGLRGRIQTVPFTDAEIETIKEGKFKLTDIKQDPNFQDCWFLSSLTSVLAARGPGKIQDLINIPESQNQGGVRMAQVKLGGEVYNVPLAKIYGNVGHGVSFSKPWVKLLETAMQMHLMHLHENGVTHNGAIISASMSYGNPDIALSALLGKGTGPNGAGGQAVDTRGISMSLRIDKDDLKATIDSIKTALKKGSPVVLGSPQGLWASLSTGISPGHAVSVLDVMEKKDGTAYFQILDPYNRSVSVSSNILLKGATIIIGDSLDPAKLREYNNLGQEESEQEAPAQVGNEEKPMDTNELPEKNDVKHLGAGADIMDELLMSDKDDF